MKTRAGTSAYPVRSFDDSTTRRRDEYDAFIELSVVLNAFHDKLWRICSAVTLVAEIRKGNVCSLIAQSIFREAELIIYLCLRSLHRIQLFRAKTALVST